MSTTLLISASYFPPHVGGISHMMAEICACLGPDMVSALAGLPEEGIEDPRVARLHVYRRPRAFDRRSAMRPFWLAAALAEIAIRERPRLLMFATTADTDIAWWVHRLFRLPYIIFAYGNEILDAIGTSWAKPRQVLTNAARVVAISRYTAGIVEQAGVDRSRIEIIHPGCDVQRFRPLTVDAATRRAVLGDRASARVILTVGGLVERKGHDIAIMAMKRIVTRVPDACYVIVGDGPHRSVLQDLVRELGLTDRVIFAGRVSEEQLPNYYALCDVFLMASRERAEQCDVEGFGIVFLEAGACGKPSVGGRSGGVEDAVLDGHTGLLVEPNDPELVADAVESLLLDSVLAKRLGDQAREHVASEHSWSRIGTRLDDMIHSILTGTDSKRQR